MPRPMKTAAKLDVIGSRVSNSRYMAPRLTSGPDPDRQQRHRGALERAEPHISSTKMPEARGQAGLEQPTASAASSSTTRNGSPVSTISTSPWAIRARQRTQAFDGRR